MTRRTMWTAAAAVVIAAGAAIVPVANAARPDRPDKPSKPVATLIMSTVTAHATVSAEGIVTGTATCPDGTQVTGGGYDFDSIRGSATSSDPNGSNGWEVVGVGLDVGQQINVFAMCAAVSTP